MRVTVRFVFAYGRIMIFIDYPRVRFIGCPPRPDAIFRNPRATLFCKRPTTRWTCKCRHVHWEEHYNDHIMDALIQEELRELRPITF